VLDIVQAHHPVGQQFQRPAVPSIGSLATGQGDQLRLSLAIQAATLGAFSREASGEGHLQILSDKPLFDANDGAATDGEGLSNLPVGVAGFALPADRSSAALAPPGSAWLEYGWYAPSSPAIGAAQNEISLDTCRERFPYVNSFLAAQSRPTPNSRSNLSKRP
jgi:hypothetical protein